MRDVGRRREEEEKEVVVVVEEEKDEEEEERNVTGCGDNICQGNKRSYSSFPACSYRPLPK